MTTAPDPSITTALGGSVLDHYLSLLVVDALVAAPWIVAGVVVVAAAVAVFRLGVRWERRRPGGTADLSRIVYRLGLDVMEAAAALDQARRTAAAYQHRAGRSDARAVVFAQELWAREALALVDEQTRSLAALDAATDWTPAPPTTP